MWRIPLLVAAVAAAVLGGPGLARAAPCGLPDTTPLWIDQAAHNAPIPVKPGIIAAVSSGVDTPAAFRAAGAATVMLDLNFNNRVGTPVEPTDPATIVDRANRLFDYAVQVTGCSTPTIAENELFGAFTTTPWSPGNAQYRANVLTLLRQLAARGAYPYLNVALPPFTGGEAGDWWREVAKVAVIVRQVFFTSPTIPRLHAQGPLRASRGLRMHMRGLVREFTTIGIPPSRVALSLQFVAARGQGGREGLQPRTAWFEMVKLQALAARQVAREVGIAAIWSWGWATYSEAGVDPDKPDAACVYLWARDPALCDGPRAAGPGFDASLTSGQILLPSGTACTLAGGAIRDRDLEVLTRVTGDRQAAATALLQREVERAQAPVSPARVVAAERALAALRFGGSRAAFLRATARAGLPPAHARAVVADQLRRAELESRVPVAPPRASAIEELYRQAAGLPARRVEVEPRAPWLGGTTGIAVSSLAPPRALRAPASGRAIVWTRHGPFAVRARGRVQPLAAFPLAEARPALAAALVSAAREEAYRLRSVARQNAARQAAVCAGDDIPAAGSVDVADFVPELALP